MRYTARVTLRSNGEEEATTFDCEGDAANFGAAIEQAIARARNSLVGYKAIAIISVLVTDQDEFDRL